MRRVLVVADYDAAGGTGTYLKRLLAFLARRFSVHLVLREGQGDPSLARCVAGNGIRCTFDYSLFPYIESGLRRLARRAKLSLFYLFLRDTLARARLERRYRPDFICISQGGGCNYFAFLISRKPVLIVAHSVFRENILDDFGGSLYKRFFQWVDVRSKRICVVSDHALSLFLRNMGSKRLADCSARIHNFGEDPNGKYRSRHRVLRVLTLGHLVGYKDPKTWLAVAKKVVAAYPGQVEFVWAGTGNMLQEMHDEALPYEDIHFIGFCPDVGELYRESDIYFQPSIWENHSIAVVEAMAHCIPCVVSSAGGLPESIGDGVEGFVREPGDIQGFCQATSRLVADRTLRESLGLCARKKYEAEYSREQWEENMDTLIAQILR